MTDDEIRAALARLTGYAEDSRTVAAFMDVVRRAQAAALRDAADDWDANTNHACDAPRELRDAAASLDPAEATS